MRSFLRSSFFVSVILAAILGVSIGVAAELVSRASAAEGDASSKDAVSTPQSAVFMILPYTIERARFGGTAFLLETPNEGKIIVTNRHVCEAGEGRPYFYLINKDSWYVGTMIAMSENTDLCLIQPPKALLENHAPLSLSSRPLKTGDTVEIWGHPRLLPLQRAVGTFININWEPVNTPRPFSPDHKMFIGTMDIDAAPGNSGSPVLNILGDVVGVLFALDPRVDQVLFVPADELKTFIEMVR